MADPHDLTETVFPDGAPVDLQALKEDPATGDGVYAGDPFAEFDYVVLGDQSRAHYEPVGLVWNEGPLPPSPPVAGSIIADLPTLRSFVGASSTVDDERLQAALDASTEFVYARVYTASRTNPDVQHAIIMSASRLFKRRQSPEGTAGFGGEGIVVRILATDPDVRALLDRHLDCLAAGVG